MGPTNIKFVGSPCGQHGPYTFYKAFKFRKDSKTSILSLGEFFFVKIFKDVEVCIGELQLLWEDRYNPGSYLCMVRLYFLPEQTPDGRKGHHGEDEVLMESDKVPFLLEDLISLLASDIEWTAGSQSVCSAGSQNLPRMKMMAADVLRTFDQNNKGLDMREINVERQNLDEADSTSYGSQVVILNYTQYCRFRAMSKRLEGCKDSWMKNVLVGAMGGVNTIGPKTKVLFCRDMFEHPVIQEHEMRQDHLAPNLRGRPKKKRMNFRKYEKDHVYSNDSDSCDSVSSSEKSSARSTPQKMREKGQCSPQPFKIEKPKSPLKPIPVKLMGKNNITALKKRVNLKEQQEEDAIDISPFKPKGEISKEEERFFKKLGLFMKRNQIKMTRLPTLGFKPVDLYQFYTMTVTLGGYDQVTERRKWKHIYDQLGGSAGNTSAATCTRRHYEKFLLAYEKYAHGDKKAANSMNNKNVNSEDNNIQKSDPRAPVTTNNLIKKKIKDLVNKEPVKIEMKLDQNESNNGEQRQNSAEIVHGNTLHQAIVSSSVVTTLQNSLEGISPVCAVINNTANNQHSSDQNNIAGGYMNNSSNSQGPLTVANSKSLSHLMPGNGGRILPLQVQRPTLASKEGMKMVSPGPQNVLRPPMSAHNNPLPLKPTSIPTCQNKPVQTAHAMKKWNEPPRMFPVGPVTHSLLYTASKTGKPKVAFLNSSPGIRNVFATHIVYGEPFVRPSHPPDEDAQMRRCISLGKANMNLNLVTPPPAHCNPSKSVIIQRNNSNTPPPAHCNSGKSTVGSLNSKKRPVHLPVQKTYPSTQVIVQKAGPSQPKKPRLVSDFLSLPKNTQNAPPRNPFVNKGVVSVIQTGPNVTIRSPPIVQPSTHPRLQNVQVHQLKSQQQQPGMQVIRNNMSIPASKLTTASLDFCGKPLSVQVSGVNVKNSGRIDSPIVISPAPTSTEEPVNLCVSTDNTGVGTTPANIVLNANNLFQKLSPLAAAPPGAIIPFVAMQNSLVSMTPSNIVSVSPSNIVAVPQQSSISVPTSSIVPPVVAIPNNLVPNSRTQNPLKTVPGVIADTSKLPVKQQAQQQVTRVVTPKAGDPPPLSPQVVHPAFLNQVNGTVQPQIMLPAQLTTSSVGTVQTSAVGSSNGGKSVNIAMVPYMIPLQQMQQLYTQAQQQVAVNVSTSVPITK